MDTPTQDVPPPPAETVAAVARYEAARNAEEMAVVILHAEFIACGYAAEQFDNAVTVTYVNGWDLARTIRLTVAAEVVTR